MKKFNSFFAVALCATAVMVSSCSDETDGYDGSENATTEELSILEVYTYDVVVARYSQLATDAKALLEASEAIEASSDDDKTSLIATAAEAWLTARVSWERTEAYLFGPVDQAGIDPGIDSWPLALTSLQALINNWDDLQEVDGLVAGLAGDFKGFHAIEYVLFKDGEIKTVTVNDFTEEYAVTVDTEDLESYLVAVCEELYRCVLQLEAEWYMDGMSGDKLSDLEAYLDDEAITLITEDGNYAEIFSKPSLDNAYYSSFNTCLNEALLGAAGIAEEVADVKISDPINAGATLGLLKVESWFSWNSIDDFTNNIRGIKEAYMGKLCSNEDTFDVDTTPATNSIGALYAESDAVAAAELVTIMNEAIAAVKAMSTNGAFRNNLSWNSENTAAKNAVLALQEALESADDVLCD